MGMTRTGLSRQVISAARESRCLEFCEFMQFIKYSLYNPLYKKDKQTLSKTFALSLLFKEAKTYKRNNRFS